jgi:hypothetical protein
MGHAQDLAAMRTEIDRPPAQDRRFEMPQADSVKLVLAMRADWGNVLTLLKY